MTAPMPPDRRPLLEQLDGALWTALETGREAADRHDPIGVADCLEMCGLTKQAQCAQHRDVDVENSGNC